MLGAALAWQASTLNEMLTARALQGLGVAGPRIVALAIIRDIYEGRRMAQIMSYAMIIFALVPAIAPFCLIATLWLALRQPETLHLERRRPFVPRTLWYATQECFSHRVFTLSALTQSLTFGMLFATLSTIQPLFEDTFQRGDSFPAWFALIAVFGGTASIINARLVVALGMRVMIQLGLGGLTLLSVLVLILGVTATLPFAIFMIWRLP